VVRGRLTRCGIAVEVGVIGAALAVFVLCTSADAARAPASTPITIGALFSLTGGGNVYGPQQLKGAELAVSQLNEQGGIDGRRVRLVVRDDRSSPADGKAQMRRLIAKNGVIAVLGPSLSAVAVSADPVANTLQTPVIAVSNTAEGIVGKCAYPCQWIWRDSLGEATAVPANISAWVQSAHPTSAAIVYGRGDLLGTDEAKIAARSFRREGVRVIARVAVPVTGSVTAGVKQALAKKPDVIFVGVAFGQVAANVMRAARAAGYQGEFLGGNTFNSAATAKLAGADGAGAQSASAWYSGNDFPANTDFLSAFQQRYGQEADQFAAQAYIGVQIVADGLGRIDDSDFASKPVAEQRSLLQAALPEVAITTPLGPFRFTADHDVSQIVWILALTGTGEHRLVGFCNPYC